MRGKAGVSTLRIMDPELSILLNTPAQGPTVLHILDQPGEECPPLCATFSLTIG